MSASLSAGRGDEMFACAAQEANLTNGVRMPWLGVGMFRLADGPDQVHMMQLGRNLAAATAAGLVDKKF